MPQRTSEAWIKPLIMGLTSVWASITFAHHGVAGLGGAQINGQGAPIETTAVRPLPVNAALVSVKVDEVRYQRYAWASPNAAYARYSMLGLGYGVTPWFSAYAFLPYHQKIDEAGGQNSVGLADISWVGQVGFKYDNGFKLIPETESLDDEEDWYFTVNAGASLPTGEANYRLANGTIDPAKSTGFGRPSYSLGISALKMITQRLTVGLEVSRQDFSEYTYSDGQRMRFGSEKRFNTALIYQTFTLPEARFRLDSVLEMQYLALGRDREQGEAARATGGRVLYLMPGVRVYWEKASFALGVKTPVVTRLNEESEQQGSEGREKYRIIFSGSVMF